MTNKIKDQNKDGFRGKYLKMLLELIFMGIIGFLTLYPFILFLTNYLR